MIDPTIHQIFELHAPYRFELQRIFLKSQAGYTALILSINSSLNKESPPVWDLLLDSVGIQKRKLLKSLSLAILGEPTGIFWHTPLNSSRPMNSAELLEWLDTGFGSAVTVEELLAVNPGVKCTAGLSVHDNERVEYQILSTKDLDDWIAATKSPKLNLSQRYIEFSKTEPLILPKPDLLYDAPKKKKEPQPIIWINSKE